VGACCDSCATGKPCNSGACSVKKSTTAHDHDHSSDVLEMACHFDVFDVDTTRSVSWKKSSGRKVVRRVNFQGLDISIENDKGQYRDWYDPHSRESGKTKMSYPYGYIRRTEGADGDQVDVFLGPNEKSDKVFIVHQVRKPDFKTYDEDKVMLGFESPREAKAAYLMHYDNPRFFDSMTETTVEAFKRMFVTSKAILPNDIGPTVPGTEAPGMPMQPVMPGMIPGMMPMMGMGPPPIDVETLEGVQQLLGRIGSAPDPQLMEIASKIWGNAYTFQGQPPEQARQEIIGFLLDQQDLLGVAPEQPNLQPSPSLPVKAPSGSTDYSLVSRTTPITSGGQPQGGNSSVAGLPDQSLMNWFEQAF